MDTYIHSSNVTPGLLAEIIKEPVDLVASVWDFSEPSEETRQTLKDIYARIYTDPKFQDTCVKIYRQMVKKEGTL